MNIEEAKIIIRSLKIYYEDEKGQRDLDKEKAEMILDKQDIQAIETLLTAYEKQQKEIEELKKYEKYYEEMEEVNKKFIAVDKIKAKIEEYKKLINECPMNDEEIFCKECTEKCGFNQTIDVLQSLLKEE